MEYTDKQILNMVEDFLESSIKTTLIDIDVNPKVYDAPFFRGALASTQGAYKTICGWRGITPGESLLDDPGTVPPAVLRAWVKEREELDAWLRSDREA